MFARLARPLRSSAAAQRRLASTKVCGARSYPASAEAHRALQTLRETLEERFGLAFDLFREAEMRSTQDILKPIFARDGYVASIWDEINSLRHAKLFNVCQLPRSDYTSHTKDSYLRPRS